MSPAKELRERAKFKREKVAKQVSVQEAVGPTLI
jgi:hypothetical protein